MPVSDTSCGLPVASSVIEREVARAPVAVGLKVIEIVQLAPASTVVPQSFVCAKSELFAPVMAIALKFSEALPLFVSVMGCEELVVPMS